MTPKTDPVGWRSAGMTLAAFAAALGTACKRPTLAPRVVRVEVPIAVPCPPPPPIRRPRLPIEDLRLDTPPAEQEKAKVATIVALMGYARQLEELLAGYMPPKPKTGALREGRK